MEKFEQYKLNISEKDKILVINYLEKLKNFTKKHNIEAELYNDIEEMLFEKLQAEENLDQLKIIKIIKEVWEPEIIFSDYVEIKTGVEEKEIEDIFYQKMINSWWIRDNENAIFLWISKTLAEKIQISVLLVRILLLILIFPLWISIWVYILAWLILPVKWIDYTWKSNISYFKTQIILVLKNWIYNLMASFMKLIRFIPTKILIILKSIFIFCIKNILPVFRFFIFWLIWLFLSFWLIWLISIGSLYFTDFSFENIDFTQTLPNYFIFWIIFWIISITIFWVFSFVYGFSKKILNKYILSFWLISFIIALFLWISTWFDLIQKYSDKNEFTQKAEINIWNTGSYIINLNSLKETSFDLGGTKSIKLVHSSWSILKIEIENLFYWNDEIKEKIKSWLSKISLSNIDNNIKLNLENNKIFTKKVPFSIYYKEITLYIPEWIKFNIINNYRFYIENTFINPKYDKFINFLRNDCFDNEISYLKNEEKFVCNPDKENLDEAKRRFKENYIIENFSEISPIKHKDKYKREYYNNYSNVSDWDLYDFDWKNDKKLVFKFQDRSIDVEASLEATNSESWVIIKDFKITNIILNDDIFEKKYYKNTEIIDEFLNEE